VWSWRRDAGVKFVSKSSRATVANKPVHRGERGISRKTIAQGEPECFPLNLYARVRFFMRKQRTRPRVQRAPGFPCALLFSGGSDRHKARAHRAARMRKCVCLMLTVEPDAQPREAAFSRMANRSRLARYSLRSAHIFSRISGAADGRRRTFYSQVRAGTGPSHSRSPCEL
jgi:hypothetical protein